MLKKYFLMMTISIITVAYPQYETNNNINELKSKDDSTDYGYQRSYPDDIDDDFYQYPQSTLYEDDNDDVEYNDEETDDKIDEEKDGSNFVIKKAMLRSNDDDDTFSGSGNNVDDDDEDNISNNEEHSGDNHYTSTTDYPQTTTYSPILTTKQDEKEIVDIDEEYNSTEYVISLSVDEVKQVSDEAQLIIDLLDDRNVEGSTSTDADDDSATHEDEENDANHSAESPIEDISSKLTPNEVLIEDDEDQNELDLSPLNTEEFVVYSTGSLIYNNSSRKFIIDEEENVSFSGDYAIEGFNSTFIQDGDEYDEVGDLDLSPQYNEDNIVYSVESFLINKSLIIDLEDSNFSGDYSIDDTNSTLFEEAEEIDEAQRELDLSPYDIEKAIVFSTGSVFINTSLIIEEESVNSGDYSIEEDHNVTSAEDARELDESKLSTDDELANSTPSITTVKSLISDIDISKVFFVDEENNNDFNKILLNQNSNGQDKPDFESSTDDDEDNYADHSGFSPVEVLQIRSSFDDDDKIYFEEDTVIDSRFSNDDAEVKTNNKKITVNDRYILPTMDNGSNKESIETIKEEEIVIESRFSNDDVKVKTNNKKTSVYDRTVSPMNSVNNGSNKESNETIKVTNKQKYYPRNVKLSNDDDRIYFGGPTSIDKLTSSTKDKEIHEIEKPLEVMVRSDLYPKNEDDVERVYYEEPVSIDDDHDIKNIDQRIENISITNDDEQNDLDNLNSIQAV